MEQQTSVTTTTSKTTVNVQSSQQDIIVESTCAALLSGVVQTPSSVSLIGSPTLGTGLGGVGTNIVSETTTSSVAVEAVKAILRSSAPGSPAVHQAAGKIYGKNKNDTSKYFIFILHFEIYYLFKRKKNQKNKIF